MTGAILVTCTSSIIFCACTTAIRFEDSDRYIFLELIMGHNDILDVSLWNSQLVQEMELLSWNLIVFCISSSSLPTWQFQLISSVLVMILMVKLLDQEPTFCFTMPAINLMKPSVFLLTPCFTILAPLSSLVLTLLSLEVICISTDVLWIIQTKEKVSSIHIFTYIISNFLKSYSYLQNWY